MEHWPATLIAVVTTYVVVYSLKFYCSSLFFPLKNKSSFFSNGLSLKYST